MIRKIANKHRLIVSPSAHASNSMSSAFLNSKSFDHRCFSTLNNIQRQFEDDEFNTTTSDSSSKTDEEKSIEEILKVKTSLTPSEIVAHLDRNIVGQNDAKRAVSIALRNRWRRQQVDPSFREEIVPKNILMVGPTGYVILKIYSF